MSESDTETAEEVEFESKSAFFEAVREEGVVLGDLEYFAEGSGSATSYKARDDEGEVEDVKKSDVEAAWEEAQDGEEAEEQGEEEDEPEEIHLGTFYFSQSNWDEDADRETLEGLLNEVGWEIVGEVSSGGYRIQTER